MDAEQYAVESEKIMWMQRQAVATEELAYAQQTANLIALLAARVSVGEGRMVSELDAEIELRMGLR